MKIRSASDADLDAILGIHNDAILHSTALWTDEPVERSDREAWFAHQRTAGHPILVADIDGAVGGYASYSYWRAKYGYRFSLENSVYVADGFRGQGVGRALMEALIGHAKAGGYHVMVADIEAGNEASIALHTSLGFELEGTIVEIGFKFGRWLDLAIMRLKL
jgi:L-amino acid N-acyltransferase YncA